MKNQWTDGLEKLERQRNELLAPLKKVAEALWNYAANHAAQDADKTISAVEKDK